MKRTSKFRAWERIKIFLFLLYPPSSFFVDEENIKEITRSEAGEKKNVKRNEKVSLCSSRDHMRSSDINSTTQKIRKIPV